MDNSTKGKEKRSVFSKTWKKCKSFSKDSDTPPKFSKSKSWNFTKTTSLSKVNKIAPEGYFAVYVGPEKQRFVIRTKLANHPLFKMLLEDAEIEYGYHSEGPIMLPCDVDLFYKMLAEMDGKDERIVPSCELAYASCSPFNPSRRLGHGCMGKGYGSYSFLTPSRGVRLEVKNRGVCRRVQRHAPGKRRVEEVVRHDIRNMISCNPIVVLIDNCYKRMKDQLCNKLEV